MRGQSASRRTRCVLRRLGLDILSYFLFGVVALTGCAAEHDTLPRVHDGNADRGRAAISRYECGVCHVIPGVPGASGRVGPPLDAFARHPYIAGKFPNEPEVLVSFLPDAPAHAPQTAMPAIAMSDQDARDIAAYLYELD